MTTTRDGFVHLHNHTEYSMLDGAAKIKPMVAEAVRLGQTALGITDHGYLFGAYEFYRECTDAGIKPIIGLEAYVTPGTSRFDTSKVLWGEPWQKDDDVSARGTYTHLTLLAHSTEGVHNLFRMGSMASLEGQVGKYPRIDKDLMSRYHEGITVLSGCPSSAVQTRMRLGQWDQAVEEASELRDIFGAENFYIEMMDHGIEIERKTRDQLPRLAKLLNAPLVVTNDSHYVSKEDARTQEAMLALQSTTTLLDKPYHEGGPRFAFEGDTFYLRSSEEMRRTWKEMPHALDSTLAIAEKSDVSFRTTDDGANFMPRFQTPEGEDERSWFVKEVRRGLHRRFGEKIPNHVLDRAEFEEGVILQMGFPGYFLVVADFISWAKERGIRVGPGRGSGAGSMVAYAMGITDLDPIEHGLLFERFLNPERVSMPDFDVDFDERRRDEVIAYVRDKYGDDRVAQVVTYGKLKSKQALKDSARVLGREYRVGEELTKALPGDVMGKSMPLSGIFDENHKRYSEANEFRKLYEERPDIHEVFDLAQRLEGITRQWGVHACAVIMSSEPLADIIPVMKRPQDGAIITQFDYPSCEDLGLLKMDFLGLRNLTVISDALENIRLNGKEVPDLDALPLDDKKTYELLGRGETLGIFQLEGGGMRELLAVMQPDNFEDISAVGALYRPGPMGAGSHTNYALRKNGRQAVVPIHPELEKPLEDILGTTYGLIVYQEQVMQIAQRVAGYSLGQADMLRRAMGKKKKEILDKEFEPFKEGMFANGFSADAVNTLWGILVPFSDYAFNKSHSAAYGLVSYWTAYLKANFPEEYMAALLTSAAANTDRRALYLAECRHMGIEVARPDVNFSHDVFTADSEGVRFGMASIRNVGKNVVDGIVAAREEKGRFTSFQDFLDKVPVVVCNKRTIQSLIKAGAFDGFGHPRRALLARSDDAVDAVIDLKRNEAHGQYDLFAEMLGGSSGASTFTVEIPDIPEWDRKQKLAFERDMLGLYVSDHPLRGMERSLPRYQDVEIGKLKEDSRKYDNQRVTIAGLVTGLEVRLNKQGLPWAKATIEDFSGSMDVLFFPRQYEGIEEILQQDQIVAVTGRVGIRDEAVSMTGSAVRVLELRDRSDQPVEITMSADQCSPDNLRELARAVRMYPGGTRVRVNLRDRSKQTTIDLGDKLLVEPGSSFYAAVKGLLGADSIS
ncbi:DNA polymerase III subunit alpha [Actinomyces minihominis]|uniref:DNA polymerase III subunit alpha n=1 Tax=Actinomyces minihominis TaxID=2002838 RepID=UPI000C06BDB3|nr:DNA polymerase III subunit alpha [Actinomyces minihominis]